MWKKAWIHLEQKTFFDSSYTVHPIVQHFQFPHCWSKTKSAAKNQHHKQVKNRTVWYEGKITHTILCAVLCNLNNRDEYRRRWHSHFSRINVQTLTAHIMFIFERKSLSLDHHAVNTVTLLARSSCTLELNIVQTPSFNFRLFTSASNRKWEANDKNESYVCWLLLVTLNKFFCPMISFSLFLFLYRASYGDRTGNMTLGLFLYVVMHIIIRHPSFIYVSLTVTVLFQNHCV